MRVDYLAPRHLKGDAVHQLIRQIDPMSAQCAALLFDLRLASPGSQSHRRMAARSRLHQVIPESISTIHTSRKGVSSKSVCKSQKQIKGQPGSASRSPDTRYGITKQNTEEKETMPRSMCYAVFAENLTKAASQSSPLLQTRTPEIEYETKL